MIAVKICGLRNQADIDVATHSGASYIGCVFVEKSPRYITPQQAAQLQISLPKIAVTSNADDALLTEIMHEFNPDYIQLHGGETAERANQITSQYGVKLIKAFAINETTNFTDIANFPADMYLFDTPKPSGSQIEGGNGVSFDWDLLTKYAGDTAYFLSGGLDASNVHDAMTKTKYIDISSGVEASKGVKNHHKIREFLQVVNGI